MNSGEFTVFQTFWPEAAGISRLFVFVLVICAARLIDAKWLARARGRERVDRTVFGESALKLLTAKFGEPADGWTHSQRVGGGGATGRLPGPQARRAGRLADHLARPATTDVDV